MKLSTLAPHFIRVTGNGFREVESYRDAQGIYFLCPFCFQRKGSAEGVHSVLVWFAGRDVPDDETPAPRWRVSGSGYDDLTITPSIDLGPGEWHGFVTRGEVS